MAKARSPNYPLIDLKTAIERVGVLYKKDHQNRMDPEAVAISLGYKGLNGKSLGVLSALRKYRLLEQVEGKKLRVSSDAVVLLVDRPDSDDRRAALVRAAFNPKLFAELRDEFATPPSADNLRIYLQKRGFTASAAEQAAASYLDTIALLSSNDVTDNANRTVKESGGGVIPNPKEQEERSEKSKKDLDGQEFKSGAGSLWLKVPFAGATLSVKIDIDGQMLTKNHVNRIIKYLELAKDDLEESGFLVKPGGTLDGDKSEEQ